MNKKELINKILKETQKEEYSYYGIRFENLERSIGDIATEKTRHNSDRESERDFPEYGTEEYEEMEEFDGLSAWSLGMFPEDEEYLEKSIKDTFFIDKNDIVNETRYSGDRCYLMASNDIDYPDAELDYNETVLIDPIVLDVIF